MAPDGTELWSYDTGDPVRSSPVLGRAPKGDGKIVYVGSSNGVLYALDAETGKRRWSFDTTPGKAGLSDRNDLNGSPALGKRGVYIGGEHGRVWFVPYDFCRKSDHKRCTTDPSPEFRPTVTRTFAVTPGGTTLRGSTENVPAATTLAARLVVRRDGETIDAAIDPASLSVTAKPSFTFTSELSGDGHFLFIRPDAILKPETDYRVQMSGAWTAEGANGTFSKTLHYVTGPLRHKHTFPAIPSGEVQAIELTRLALPQPALLPSVNQIGFDSYDLIAGWLTPQRSNQGKQLLWVIGGRAKQDGTTVADPAGGFAFPLFGTYDRGQTALNTSQVSLQFSFGPVPLRSLDFRGATRLDGSLQARRQPLRPGHLRRRAQLLGAAADRRRLQQLRHARLIRDLPQRRLPGRRREREAPRGARDRGPDDAADRERRRRGGGVPGPEERHPLPGERAPGLGGLGGQRHRRPRAARLPLADHALDRRRRQPHRRLAADPGRNPPARGRARVRGRGRVPARAHRPVADYDPPTPLATQEGNHLPSIADFGLGEALLTTLSIFFFVIWIWILITILSDLFRDHETSGWGKAAWVFFLVFVPFLAALIYLGVRGSGMRERAIAAQNEAKAEMDTYIRDTASSSPVDELQKLSELHEKGSITDEEFEKMKAKLVE